MATENTHDQYSDSDEAVAEQLSVSPTNSFPPSSESTIPAEATVNEHHEGQVQQEEAHSSTFKFVEEAPLHSAEAVAIEHETTGDSFSFSEVISPVEEEAMRPFTDFFEEFRQAEEARFSSTLRESTAEPPDIPWEGTSSVAEPSAARLDEPGEVKNESIVSQVEQTTVNILVENTTAASDNTQAPTATAPVTPVERPVSPLLRPPSRLRLPRHGAGRQREEQVTAEKAPVVPPPEATSTQEQQRPARRYRFDRPAAANSPGITQIEEVKEKDSLSRTPTLPSVPARGAVHKEAKEEEGQPKQAAGVVQPTEPKQPTISETPVTNGGGTTAEAPAVASYDRHRRSGQDRQPALSHAAPVAPAAEVVIPEPAVTETVEVAPEDLPPLEYSELQRASSRRRRRRRTGDTAPTTPTSGLPAKPVGTEPTVPAVSLPVSAQPLSVAVARNVPPTPAVPPSPAMTSAAGQYNIVSGYTVSQMNQSDDGRGPFMSPDPSPARGSTSVRGGTRTVRVDAQRPAIYPVRSGDAAVNQLTNAVVQAIQSQTDRMVSELRRAGQGPTNVAVTLPPFPSTERVGVFVDVANLLYSARTLRMAVDFAKLLDFLRGNRRLVRAHAYCPTSPQSGDDQMFLQAVKGLGYRITTKNYKTFSSGAKKADLDLDLCMDVVRLVDGRAVDCIVLVSGDSDFMPMLDYCSDHGVRVEVAAFDEAISATLRQSCDLFINLASLEEIRA